MRETTFLMANRALQQRGKSELRENDGCIENDYFGGVAKTIKTPHRIAPVIASDIEFAPIKLKALLSK